MNIRYETHQMNWQGIALLVRWAPHWSTGICEIAHLEIKSCDRQPLPITETGYRSHFIHREHVEEAGGPVAYACAWLDHEAQSEAWKKAQEEARQFSLF